MMPIHSRRAFLAAGVATGMLAAPFIRSARAASPGLKLGCLTDLNGPYADLTGQGSIGSIKLAIEDFGKLHPEIPVELTYADFSLKPDTGLSIMRGWLDNDGVDAVLDFPMSALALAAGRVLEEKNKVGLITSAATSELTRGGCGPHFMDIESFQKEPVRVDLAAKYPQFKIIMLVVAPLERSSNVQLAVTILAGVVRLYPYVGLIIVGEGSLHGAIKAYASKVGMGEHVMFENGTDNISSYYKTARIFVVTAPYEEHEDTIAHAAAASCAIVSTKVGIAPSIIEDGVSGFLCESDDPARFVASIILMIRKPGLCDGVRLNANLAIQKFMDSDEKAYLQFTKGSWEQAISMTTKENRAL